ncbi:hypothetical protein SUGI_0484640 [Cryptomeria japonica]|nr:hypothetical protein SUGI_0484640 [Cryptomeria japonica]
MKIGYGKLYLHSNLIIRISHSRALRKYRNLSGAFNDPFINLCKSDLRNTNKGCSAVVVPANGCKNGFAERFVFAGAQDVSILQLSKTCSLKLTWPLQRVK